MTNIISNSIDALVAGFKDGGCLYTTNFAGFNSHIIFDKLCGKQMSMNERIAYELAYGASMSGKRSVVTFKGVGLNVASDVFLHSVLNGINAGLVVVLTDDIEAISSPESQDSRSYIDFFGGLWFEPTSIQEAYDFAYQSFEWSEKLDVPVVIRLTNQFFNLYGKCSTKPQKNKIISIENRRSKYISYWKTRSENLKKKNSKIQRFVEEIHNNHKNNNHQKGIIIAGNCVRELNKFDQSQYDILNIYAYPIPKNLIKKFCQNKLEIVVLEQGNDYVFQQVLAFVDSKCKLILNTGDRPNWSKGWVVWNDLEKLFRALKKTHPSFVVGDEGSFTDESTQTIKTCLSMGASVGVAAGLAENNVNYPFCVIGDTSFTFSSQQTLVEVKERGLNFGIIIIDNGGAKTTGGQKIIGNIYDVGNIPSIIVDYERVSENKLYKILLNMKLKGELSILYVKTK